MTTGAVPREAALDLLARRATEGIDPSEEARLRTLLRSESDLDAEYFERAAAVVDLAVDVDLEPLPSDTRLRLVVGARRALAPASLAPAPGHGAESATVSDRVVSFRREAVGETPGSPAPGFDWARWSGWFVAAGLAGFMIGLRFLTPVPPPEPGKEIVAATPRSVGERRERLIASAPDLRRIVWTATDHPLSGGVEGEVVWSDSAQEGYMTFRGLAWNDPTQRQYQLWVFDARRSSERPVDGGVFDIPASSGVVVVPIDAKLPVDEATLFAITLEPPGGVVVSTREDLLLVAPVA